MRHAATNALILLLGLLLLSGVASAQTTATNTVTVHIPTVLRLRLDQGTPSSSQALDVTVNGTIVTPASVTVRVFANTDWTLSVSDNESGVPTLDVCTDPGILQSCRPIAPEAKVASGGPTGGWEAHALGLRVDEASALPAAGGSHTLTFTLSRP